MTDKSKVINNYLRLVLGMMYWIYLFLLIPLNMILPISWGDENGVIENIQLACLIVTSIICYRHRNIVLRNWGGSQTALCYAGALFFFLLTMREISWGRALLLHPDGGIYQYSEMGLYGQLVHPMVGILLFLLIYLLYQAKIWVVIRTLKFPTSSFIMLMLFILMSWIGEKGSVDIFHGELAEELSELGVYIMMYTLVNNYFTNLCKK